VRLPSYLAATAFAMTAVACAALLGVGSVGYATDAGDADLAEGDAPTDGGDEVALDAGSDALLRNGGFEEEGAVCGPGWMTVYGAAERTTTSHGGMYGCQLCNPSDAASGGYGAVTQSLRNPSPGNYTFQYYAEEGPDGGGEFAFANLTWTLADGGTVARQRQVSVPATFASVSVGAVPVPSGSTLLTVELEALLYPGGCVVVDDALLTYGP
jgi:hypothetical protein